MSNNPYRDMIAQLAAALQQQVFCDPEIDGNDLPRQARELLDQPEPPELTDETLLRLAARAFGYVFRDGGIGGGESEFLVFARAAIAADRARRGTSNLAETRSSLGDAPQPESEKPAGDKLMDIACATNLVHCMGKGRGFAGSYKEDTDITAEVLAFAHEVLAKYGNLPQDQ